MQATSVRSYSRISGQIAAADVMSRPPARAESACASSISKAGLA